MDAFGLEPLAGGHSGETFLADAAGERTVVRVYGPRSAARGPEAPRVDAAVLALVRGLLPVPEVLEVRRADPGAGSPGLLVTSFLPGTRLDLLLPGLDEQGRARVGHQVGEVVARLAQMPMPRPGLFVDGDLRTEPLPGGDLATFAEQRRPGTALALWPEHEWDALLAVADRAQELLDRVARTCLVHSDLNPKNLLVDPDTLEVTGVLDWEFAHAGGPATDLGNLLRFDRDPAFADAVLEVCATRVPDAGDDVLDRARAADLYALVDLAARRGENPVTERAHDLLRAVASSGDLHAVP
ncbi:MAG TPA: phosphotransferase [Nocardioidaceae bacterium]|nr:phosphotransferase [Nocardioidaceae bacterium]